jgi:hypothetical protein
MNPPRFAPVHPRTQTDLVLEHLRAHGPLTQPEAQDQLGCLRLGARIWDLKQRGHVIRTDFVGLPSGQRVARYTLLREAPETTEADPAPGSPSAHETPGNPETRGAHGAVA